MAQQKCGGGVTPQLIHRRHSSSPPGASGCTWSTARATAPSPGQPTPGVVKQDKSSGGSVDTTKTRSDPQRVRMSSGERPVGAANNQMPRPCANRPPPLAQARPRSQKSRQNSASTPTPVLRQGRGCARHTPQQSTARDSHPGNGNLRHGRIPPPNKPHGAGNVWYNVVMNRLHNRRHE